MLPFLRADLAEFVAYTPHDDDGDSPQQPARLDSLDTNESPFDLPKDVKQKLAWHYQHEIQTNRYPDGGHSSLKQAIATYIIESAPSDVRGVTPAHISVGNGSDELIRSLLIATCLGGAGSVLVAEPTFSMYKILAQTLGIPVAVVPRAEETFAVNLTAAQTALTTTQFPPVRIVFMVHPNSPTGNPLTPTELNWLQTLPPDILVVIDEAYFEFSQQTTVAEILRRPNWVVTRTFSKAFSLAAHRVGYAIATPDLITILEKVRLPYNLPSFSQSAVQVALAHRQMLLKQVPLLLQERNHLQQTLRALPNIKVWGSAANFIYGRFHNPNSDQHQNQALTQTIFEQLKAQGTLIRHTGGGLRITVGSPAENQRTCDRLSAILAHLNENERP
ncbi:MAG: histidinol-phosphate transaminase [Cyanobacteria bacterium P01_A01_bin.123]